jgi:uncharacterized protein YwqG
MEINPGGAAAVAVLLVGLAALPVRNALRRWRRERAGRESVRAFREDFARRNPPGPPLTPEETAGFQAFVDGLVLPAVDLRPVPGAPVTAAGSRLGGPVWLPAGEAWPLDREGRPLEFLAQLDFSDVPPLPDFPASGLIQVFVGRDDLFGCDFDDQAGGDFLLRWHERLDGQGRLVPPPPLDHESESSPWMDLAAREAGVALRGEPVLQRPTITDWRIDERWDGWLNRDGFTALEERLCEQEDGPGPHHHIGGHPVFTQNDFREGAAFRDHDRCLLRLTSDAYLMWGDCGEAVFTLPADALRQRDWSRVAYNWDCS